MNEPKIEVAIGQEFPKKVIPLIKKASKEILIMVYDWGWYPDEIGEQCQIFNAAIVRAHQNGIFVEALVHKRLIKEILARQNIPVRRLMSSKLMHVKLMIIDRKISILGSHNYSKNAFNINHEASVIIHDENIAKRFREYYAGFCY